MGRWDARWVRQLRLWVTLWRVLEEVISWRRYLAYGLDVGDQRWSIAGSLDASCGAGTGSHATLVDEYGGLAQAIVVRRTRFLHSYRRRKRKTNPSWLCS